MNSEFFCFFRLLLYFKQTSPVSPQFLIARRFSFLNLTISRVYGIVGIIKGSWLEGVQEEAGSFSERMVHEHVRASMMTNFDKEDDSIDDVKQIRGNGMNASGARKLSKINASSQEEVMLLLQSMQNRIDVLERNAGIRSPPASQAGEMEESDGPITQESGGCTVQ